MDSLRRKPVDGLVATSTISPVNTICPFCLRVNTVVLGTVANKPSKLPVVSLVRFSLATPSGRSVVVTEVTG